ncbi:MAG: (E)-4-hydroxy-3-methylbut-2-enyl-diphosphate synthase [Bacillota bacterium]|nr:MAG: (E)-4-hydroxy-3-methylbut-2-enyl-diphosphate synthase [Bacillota bacterium]
MRRKTRAVQVGSVTVGGGAPISIQSMTNTSTKDQGATLGQIQALYQAGCDIVRIAVPDNDSLLSVEYLVHASPVPLVADVHFDYRLAVGAIERGIAKVRIHPGNIGGFDKAEQVLRAALRHKAAVRIGVNSGSLPKELLARYQGPRPEAMVECALEYVKWIEYVGLDQVVFSLKSSDVAGTILAYQLFSQAADYPLHIGVTEAGTLLKGAVRSAVGLGILLSQGIGDTLRIALTADPVEEVSVAQEILSSLGIGAKRLRVISCPTCGRTSGDLISLAQEVEQQLKDLSHIPLKVAVMGCSVNGPGEAKEAHVGIALAKGKAVLFRHGKPVELLPLSHAAERLVEEARVIASTFKG